MQNNSIKNNSIKNNSIKNNSIKNNFKKTIISVAMAGLLTQAAPIKADVLDFDFSGLHSLLLNDGFATPNTLMPYYNDATWGYGQRTQISGTMSFDTVTGAGSISITPFSFSGFPIFDPIFHDMTFQSVGANLMIGNILRDSNGGINDVALTIVWDATGLLSAIPGLSVNDTVTGVGVLPASNSLSGGLYPIGLSPFATSSINTDGLSLGVDDGIGGSPEIGTFAAGVNANFDITSMTLTNCTGLCGSDKVGYLKVRFRNSFSTVADPGTVFAGLELTTGNVALQAKSHDYPINIDAVGNLLNWLEINNETTLPDGISAIRSYQQLGGFNGFTLISVTGGNACMDAFSCDVSLGVDSFITTRSSMVNVAATALIADAPVRWQKFCTHVFNNASNLVEPVCGHGKFIEMD